MIKQNLRASSNTVLIRSNGVIFQDYSQSSLSCCKVAKSSFHGGNYYSFLFFMLTCYSCGQSRIWNQQHEDWKIDSAYFVVQAALFYCLLHFIWCIRDISSAAHKTQANRSLILYPGNTM